MTVPAVSVVLNGSSSSARISSETRTRILEAAARLKYRRNGVALGLYRRRMNTIGVTATIGTRDTNLYFLAVLNGILRAATEHDQSTTIFSVADWERDASRILEFCDGRIDGLILIAPDMSSTFAATLARCTPYVTVHSDVLLPDAPNIDVDNEAAAYSLTRYLCSHGHRRILHFAGNATRISAKGRLAGYKRAMEEGSVFDPTLVLEGEFTSESGARRTEVVLSQYDEETLPTAIFCANDAIAYGCMDTLAAHGVRVPEDVSVVGFDDVLLARVTRPLLTTMRQPFTEMTRRAVELLLSQIASDSPEDDPEQTQPAEPGTIAFPVELVERESVGPPRHS